MKLKKAILLCIATTIFLIGCARTDTIEDDRVITASTAESTILETTVVEEATQEATEDTYTVQSTEPTSETQSETTSTSVPTNPIETTPVKAPVESHKHSYTVTECDATCTKPPYKLFLCSCGHSYKEESTTTPPNDHKYQFTYSPIPDEVWRENMSAKCTVCGYSYSDTVNIRSLNQSIAAQIEERTVYWLNQYRKEAGASACQMPTGFQAVADYRAKQLLTNFSHDTSDLREACAHFSYGEFLQPEGWNPSEYYYTFNGAEAIATGFIDAEGIDATAKYLADLIRSSPSHWSYISDSRFTCIAVGIAYRPGNIVGVVFVSEKNYG